MSVVNSAKLYFLKTQKEFPSICMVQHHKEFERHSSIEEFEPSRTMLYHGKNADSSGHDEISEVILVLMVGEPNVFAISKLFKK